jgi:putative hydrolase of the HAD superfamily
VSTHQSGDAAAVPIMTPSPGATPTAVLFDFGGTLDADGIAWKARFFEACRREGLTRDPSVFDPVFYAVDDALVGAVPPTLTFEDTVLRLGEGLARRLGSTDRSAGARIARRFLGDAFGTLARNTPLLARLRRRYRLGIVSNFYGNLGTVCHNAGVHELFEVIVDSACVGCAKPDPRIFQSALDALEVGPADAWFVGDSLQRDMAGARAIGMPHVWLAGAAPASAACCPADPIVHSFGDLEELLL